MAKTEKVVVPASYIDTLEETFNHVDVTHLEETGCWVIEVQIDSERRVEASHEKFNVALLMVQAAINAYEATL